MDLVQWQKNRQVLFMVPINISIERAARIIPKQIKVSLLPDYRNEAYFLITHPTTDLPTQPLCHSIVAPFLNMKTITWILGVPNCEDDLYKQSVVITDKFAPTEEYESSIIICNTDSISKFKTALDYNISKTFRVYIKYRSVFDYVRKTNRLYEHFLLTSSVIYPGKNDSIIIDDKS